MESHRFQKLYDRIHENNRKRIKGGLLCMLIIPLIFLFLMFISNTSKIFFLVLWIVSIFVIAIYLITVEYIDYLMQQEIFAESEESDEQESLIDITGSISRRIKVPERREEE